MVSSFYDFYKTLVEDPEFNWLTLEHESKSISYSYKELHFRITEYYELFNIYKLNNNDIVLIILKESLDLFAAFIAGAIYGVMPAYYAYPSPKQSVKQFVKSMDTLILFNDIKLIICYPELNDILLDYNYGSNRIIINADDIAKYSDDQILHNGNGVESFLQFSSGTTGAKKGVKISSKALFNQINAYKPHVQFEQSSTVVSWLPHYHDMGLIACMLMPLFEKVPIVMLSPFEWVANPASLLESIQNHKGTHTWQPNFALGHLVKSISYEETKNYDLSSIKKLVCCSEPVLHKTVEKFIHHFAPSNLNPEIIHNCYAMAENTFAMSVSDNEKLKFLSIDYDVLKRENKIAVLNGGFKIASAGKPLKNTQIKIVSDNKENLPEKEIGEILIRSDCILDEYHNNPEANDGSFYKKWFITGDLGFIYNDELYVTGRKKELIIVAGENIYPQDIEQIINDEEYFIKGRNVVFGFEDLRLGTEKIIILAEVQYENQDHIDLFDLKTKIFSQLNISVSDIILLPPRTLLKSTAGKISRYLNKQAYIEGSFKKYVGDIKEEKSQSSVPTLTLKSIIHEILSDKSNIPINDNTPLFTSGIIDSFGFVELVLKIESRLGIKIPKEQQSFENFETIKTINKTMEQLSRYSGQTVISQKEKKEYKKSLEKLQSQKNIVESQTFLETIINYFPLKKTTLYPWFLKILGMRIGRNVKFESGARFKLRGKISNITIGDNVRIGKNIDIRNRENGKIIINNKCYIDNNVRLVAARNGKIDLGEGTSIGMGAIVNSGGDFITGKFCLIAGNVNINSSEHKRERNKYIKEQQFIHGSTVLGDDVWIGSGASVLMNARIGDGSIVSSNSLVSGDVPEFTVFAGVPARFIRNR